MVDIDKSLESQELDLDKLVPQGSDIKEELSGEQLSMRDLRSLAFYLVYAMDQFDYTVSLESIVDNFKRGFEIEIEDGSPAIEIARAVADHREELDDTIKPFLKNWKLERLGVCTRLILRLSVWELLNTDVPHNIIINEAIELAKSFAEKDAHKFINGVLDEFVKQSLGKQDPLRSLDMAQNLEQASISGSDRGGASEAKEEEEGSSEQGENS